MYNASVNGLISGGYSTRLVQLGVHGNIWAYNFLNAVKFDRKNIIDHYPLITEYNTDVFFRAIVNYGHLDLLPDINIAPKNYQTNILSALIIGGYLEEVKKYQYLLDEIIPNGNIYLIGMCIYLNHLDMLDYLYKLYPPQVGLAINNMFALSDRTGYLMAEISVPVMEYLYNNKLVTDAQLEGMANQWWKHIKKYNDELYKYMNNIN